jgi:predicted metal-dependent hydrolase
MKENLSIHTIQYEGKAITYSLERKAVKNVNLHVYSNETIYVSAPMGVPLKDIDTFLHSKGKFILRALEKYRQRNQQKPPLSYTSGETVPILGKDKTLVVKQSPAARFDDDDSHIYLFLFNVDDIREKEWLFHKYLTHVGLKILPAVIDRIFPLVAAYGVTMPQFRIRYMKSRWGSCVPLKKSITLNALLMEAPERCIEYILLHELCHLIHANHSARFHALVTKLMPDWKERKALLENIVINR